MVLNVRYATINENDILNGEGVCVSLWLQGCPHHCPGCHNPQQWSFDGGIVEPADEVLEKIYTAIEANGIQRNFSILGGEPMCYQNMVLTYVISHYVKEKYPNIKIFLWTGYTLEELQKMYPFDTLLESIDVLIEGRYLQELRDITLKWRGSSNQRVLYRGIDF